MDWTALQEAGCEVQLDAPLSEVTTFRLGGPCRALVFCSNESQLVAAVKYLNEADGNFVLIGGGSNILISDEGLDKVVIRYCSDSCRPVREGDVLEVSGAVLLDDLARYAAECGLDGLVFACGIPGTLGGAIAGNAGAFGEQVGDVVESVLLMDHTGRTYRAPGGELGFKYRGSRLQETGEIIVSARVCLISDEKSDLLKRREEILSQRGEKHPDWRVIPTAGSFFRNIEPTSAAERRQAAGWFLEQVGALEMRVGGARVFEKHANIIVGGESCTAKDVLELSQKMAKAVEERFGFLLTPEVRIFGRK